MLTRLIQWTKNEAVGLIEHEYRDAEFDYESSTQVPGTFTIVMAFETMSMQTVIDDYSRQYQWRSPIDLWQAATRTLLDRLLEPGVRVDIAALITAG